MQSKGLQDVQGWFNDLVFLTKREGYLFGYKNGDPRWGAGGDLVRIDTPIIFRTVDGGMTWKGSSAGNEIIKNISVSDGEIYGEISSLDTTKPSIIYKLNRSTSHWDEYSTVYSPIRNFKIFNNGFGIVCVNRNNDLLSTNDKGKNWFKLPGKTRVDQIIVRGNWLLYTGSFITDEAPFSSLFGKYNLETKQFNISYFPKDFRAYFIDEYNQEYFFLGVQQKTVKLYKLSHDGKLTLIHQIFTGTKIFPKKLNVFGKDISIFIGEQESLYTTNHLYYSTDKGNHWDKQVLRNPTYSNPICFLNDLHKQSTLTWIYCGAGELQVIGKLQ